VVLEKDGKDQLDRSTDRVRNEEVSCGVKEERNILETVKERRLTVLAASFEELPSKTSYWN